MAELPPPPPDQPPGRPIPPPGPPPPPLGAVPGPPPPMPIGPAPAGGTVRAWPGAGRLLAGSIISLFCCSIIVGPIVWVKAHGVLREMARRPDVTWTNRGTVQAARVIAIVATVLGAVGILYLVSSGVTET